MHNQVNNVVIQLLPYDMLGIGLNVARTILNSGADANASKSGVHTYMYALLLPCFNTRNNSQQKTTEVHEYKRQESPGPISYTSVPYSLITNNFKNNL